MIIYIKGTDFNKQFPVEYRISKETGIREECIEFSEKVITFIKGKRPHVEILHTQKNTPCLEQIYNDIMSHKSPKGGCSFEILDSTIIGIRWMLGEKDDYYGFEGLDYSK